MFVEDFVGEYGRYRAIAEKAMAQVSDEGLNQVVAPGTNSIATLVRHMSGNFVSRFTDFLESDGEKPTRDRDGEFDAGPFTRAEIDAAWKKGWDTLNATLDDLLEDDLQNTITIRGKELSVHDALCRSLAHQAMHVGQIVLVARAVTQAEWKWISIPPGKSKEYNLNPTLEKGPRALMHRVIVEACVESLDEALAAGRAGADRLELCANMSVLGTTPGPDLIAAVKSNVRMPVSVMIRPRGGSFVHTPAEVADMRRQIDRAKELGADMLVIGVLDESGRVAEATTRELVLRAGATPVTYHKAFDEIADQSAALETLIDAGVARVLTSGGAPTAFEGRAALARLVAQAGNRLTVMAGGTVRGTNVAEILRESSVREVHARCVDGSTIRELKSALSGVI